VFRPAHVTKLENEQPVVGGRVIYIYTYTHTYPHICVNPGTWARTSDSGSDLYIYKYTYTYIYMYIYIYIYTYIHVCVYIYTYIYTIYAHTHIHLHIHIYLRLWVRLVVVFRPAHVTKLENEQPVVGGRVGLCPRDEVGGVGEGGARVAERVLDHTESEAGPLEVGAVQHVVGGGVNLERERERLY